ncbi:MAG: hypothetical protein KJ626_08725 [Verrucomicrobia bacterium]|nr:hypothetical protein [Verrucomicrobiota bacterium]
MSRTVILICGFALLLCVSTQLLAEDTPDVKKIALVNVGAVDAGTAESIRVFMEDNLTVPVRLLNLKASEEQDLVKLGTSLTQNMTWFDVCLVALVSPAVPTHEGLILAPDYQWALIDVGALKTDDAGDQAVDMRIKRQTLRSVAFLFGLPFSPDPRCVFRRVNSVQQLDEMGSNFSPPTMESFYTVAAERGLNVIARKTRRWQKRFGADAKSKDEAAPAPEQAPEKK